MPMEIQRGPMGFSGKWTLSNCSGAVEANAHAGCNHGHSSETLEGKLTKGPLLGRASLAESQGLQEWKPHAPGVERA